MIAKVIPARRMPLALSELDYSVPEELAEKIKPGHLVKAPFLKKEIFGVVSRLSGNAQTDIKKLKEISSPVLSEPVLSPPQMAFLYDMAEFYHTSLAFLLKGNLPPLQKRKLAKLADAKPVAEQTASAGPAKPSFFLYSGSEEKLNFFYNQVRSATGQLLLLVPELPDVENWKKMLAPEMLEKTLFITSEIGDKEIFSAWMQIWLGEKSIVIGTRRALFLPWRNLQTVLMDDEGNPDYKSWDMAPRFHTRDAALFLAHHHGSRLHLMSHTPSVETYYFCRQKIYDGWEALTKMPPLGRNLDVIDMRNERKAGNYNFLSEELSVKIKKRGSGDVFLFVNRRGSASYAGCRDCGNVMKCPNCGFTLTYHESDNLLKCHYCGHTEPMRPHCAVCGGVNMTMYGVGTQLAENAVRKMLDRQDTRQVVRIDSDNGDLNKLDIAGPKIVVGTQLAWPYLDWSKIELAAFLDFDTPLFIPEYKIAENLWQMLRDAQYRLPASADLTVQTNHPEHPLLQAPFAPPAFYESQLEERKVLQYPPFKFLLKVSYGHAEKDAARREADKLKNTLLGLTKDAKNVKISGPLESSPHFYGGLYWQVILAKIGYEDYKKNTKIILSKVPDAWKADPNPNSILYLS